MTKTISTTKPERNHDAASVPLLRHDAARPDARQRGLDAFIASLPRTEAEVVCVADVPRQPVSWLWHSRIACGKLTLFAGSPGQGKSFLSLDLAARVSTGRPFPNTLDDNPAGNVVLLSCEDAVADTIRPRLEDAGADLNNIHVITGVRRPLSGDLVHMLNLDDDIRRLENVVKEHRPRLVVVDPLTAYLGPNADPHKDAEVRRVLGPVADLADRYGVAVLGICHLNKRSDVANVVYRVGGSIALTAAARAVWLVIRDPLDDEHRRTFMLQGKNNLAADPGGLAYRIVPPGALEWETATVTVDADTALAGPAKTRGPEPVARTEAADWLRELLADGAKESADIRRDAKECGIAWKTLCRAKEQIKVKARKRTIDGEARWAWSLPGDDDA